MTCDIQRFFDACFPWLSEHPSDSLLQPVPPDSQHLDRLYGGQSLLDSIFDESWLLAELPGEDFHLETVRTVNPQSLCRLNDVASSSATDNYAMLTSADSLYLQHNAFSCQADTVEPSNNDSGHFKSSEMLMYPTQPSYSSTPATHLICMQDIVWSQTLDIMPHISNMKSTLSNSSTDDPSSSPHTYEESMHEDSSSPANRRRRRDDIGIFAHGSSCGEAFLATHLKRARAAGQSSKSKNHGKKDLANPAVGKLSAQMKRTGKLSNDDNVLGYCYRKRTGKLSNDDLCDAIERLGWDLKGKLKLADKLKEENCILKLKERMLQLKVENGDRIVSCGEPKGMSTNMVHLLQGFRSSMLQSKAASVLQDGTKVTKGLGPDLQGFNIYNFMSVWKALVQEMSLWISAEGPALAPASVLHRLAVLGERSTRWVVTVSLNCPKVLSEAYVTNLCNGKRLDQSEIFWMDVALKLHLSEEQIQDLVDVWKLHSGVLQDLITKRAESQLKLSQILPSLDGISPHESFAFEKGSYTVQDVAKAAEVEQLITSLLEGYKHLNSMDYMIIYLVARLITPWQLCAAVVYCYPSYPSMKAILKAVVSIAAKKRSAQY
ncbi:hypothetical protein CEUSTIGMA_g5865.t1 [Chlamydomonas eustigma]|uniref:Uncharacterized protein n=1 Tax=Chlamydomonas eustigma TaxID=1157962 RepID=A0A250X5Q9_9CHLO|nr:hypothetical protein CEUSTIGMA_g5865.t1 [Chlamydomonas eustigma]|eukprot:GAX78424.1 hypothetical protein CEUSTIGMA_g5865.t1 [Chlamydomonas eustigma]